jgi:hypothetical protein
VAHKYWPLELSEFLLQRYLFVTVAGLVSHRVTRGSVASLEQVSQRGRGGRHRLVRTVRVSAESERGISVPRHIVTGYSGWHTTALDAWLVFCTARVKSASNVGAQRDQAVYVRGPDARRLD